MNRLVIAISLFLAIGCSQEEMNSFLRQTDPNRFILDAQFTELHDTIPIILFDSIHLMHRDLVTKFYQRAKHRGVWVNTVGEYSWHADSLHQAVIKTSKSSGLTLEHYTWQDRFPDSIQSDSFPLQHYELYICSKYFQLLTDVSLGKVDPYSHQIGWHLHRSTIDLDLSAYLHDAMRWNIIGPSINNLEPKTEDYVSLKHALGHMVTDSIHFSDSSAAFVTLQAKLTEQHGLVLRDSQNLIHEYQLIHGWDTTGLWEEGFVDDYNEQLALDEQKILVNLDRLRWSPRNKSDNRIMINIPSFGFRFYKDDTIAMTKKVVVGKYSRQTICLNDTLAYFQLNPRWTIPPTILDKDVIPELGEGTEYLDKKGIKVYDTQGKQVDPTEVEWDKYTSKTLPYKLRQNPGYGNALGKVKFIFPNKYYIYVHDTPTKYHFKRRKRAYSSGCLRLDKPLDLAYKLVENDTFWTESRIDSIITRGRTTNIRNYDNIEVFIEYYTAFTDTSGTLNFRNDVYKLDEAVLNALKADDELTLTRIDQSTSAPDSR